MRERLIKVTVLVFMVILFSAGTIFVSRGTKSPDSITEQVQMPVIEEGDPLNLYPPLREFVRFMDKELDSTQTVGAAYTIVHGGEVVYTGTYGVLENGKGTKVDEHTLFRLASVSKGFAGVLACMLEQEGIFSLDDRVVEHYPGFLLKDSVNTVDLTIRNLFNRL